MTKVKNYTTTLLLLSILIGSNSFGQKIGFTNGVASKFTSTKISEGLSSSMESTVPTEAENVNEKVLSSFSTNFQNTGKVSWSQVKNKFLAKFQNDQIATETLFSKHGKILYSIESGYEKHIPADVKSLTAKTYSEYVITSVAKVSKNNRQIWVVTMAGKENDIKARIENGQIEEVETIKKG